MAQERTITEWMLGHCKNCSILATQDKMDKGELPVGTVADDAGYKTISSEKCSLCGEYIGNRNETDEPLFELTMNKVKKAKDTVTGDEETEAVEVTTLAMLCSEECRDAMADIVMANLQFPEEAVEEKEEPKEDWQG
jgi:ferredoxin